ncbi:MAG: alpha/beta hydrolase [Porticoccaceae bacterium]|nr:alpha/beta hydrolase [Porticoccaceae bacterium]
MILISYAVAIAEHEDLDRKAQKDIGGLYLPTKQGTLSYTRNGPINAPVVILVHGFSIPKFVWEQITPALVKEGYQVITFDHLGRGFSDRPVGPYDAELYRHEISDVITSLTLKTPITLVGYSMGGANVIDYAASYPEQVNRLILVAPAGYIGDPGSVKWLVKPVIGEWLATVFGTYYAGTTIKNEIQNGVAPKTMYEQFQKQAMFRGYTNSLLSTLRHYPIHDMSHRYKIVGKTNIPVFALWGTADKVTPYLGAMTMAIDVPQLRVYPIEGGSHNMVYTKAQLVVNNILVALKYSEGEL